MNSKRRIFSHQEKSLLINIIKDYKEIEEKKTEGVSLKKKEVFAGRNNTIIQQPEKSRHRKNYSTAGEIEASEKLKRIVG